MRGSRGAVLIAALLVGTIILLAGLGFLARRRAQYAAAADANRANQALMLAQAGLEDFRVKLSKSQDFPPWRPEQTVFAYSENFPGGSYAVRVERRSGSRTVYPRQVYWLVRSVGYAGPRGEPTAQRALEAELVPPTSRFSTMRDLGGF